MIDRQRSYFTLLVLAVLCTLGGAGAVSSPARAQEPPVEVCDGLDNDRDGTIDEGFDRDEDGTTTCAGDPELEQQVARIGYAAGTLLVQLRPGVDPNALPDSLVQLGTRWGFRGKAPVFPPEQASPEALAATRDRFPHTRFR